MILRLKTCKLKRYWALKNMHSILQVCLESRIKGLFKIVLRFEFCLGLSLISAFRCRGRVDNSTELKLRCFCSAECGFESRLWHLWARPSTIIAFLHPGVNGYLLGQRWFLWFSRVAHMLRTGCILPRELRWFEEWFKAQWPGLNNVLWDTPRAWKELYKNGLLLRLLLFPWEFLLVGKQRYKIWPMREWLMHVTSFSIMHAFTFARSCDVSFNMFNKVKLCCQSNNKFCKLIPEKQTTFNICCILLPKTPHFPKE